MRATAYLVVATVLLAGCYRVTVLTGAPPAAPTIDKAWQMSFVYGLVPPPEIDAKPTCSQGLAEVMTERSFMNGLVSALSVGIVTPIHTKVTCAVGPVAK